MSILYLEEGLAALLLPDIVMGCFLIQTDIQ
jgi:hypothetical protein